MRERQRRHPEWFASPHPPRDDEPSGSTEGARVFVFQEKPVRFRDRWSKTPSALGRSAFVFLGLCCIMASWVIWHSPLRPRAVIKSCPQMSLKATERQSAPRILSGQPHLTQGTADKYLEALLLERAVRNAPRPEVSSFARLARLYTLLGDVGRAALWQRRADWLLGTSAFENLRHFWADRVKGENFRHAVGALIIWGTGGGLTGLRFRLFALGCYWFYGVYLCLLLTDRFKALPKLVVHTLAGLSLTTLALVATGDCIHRRFPLGVVTAFSASTFTGPGPAFCPAGRHFLPAGTLFRVLDEAEGRLKVLTRSGETVWISANLTELL